ncbi:MAG TPA: TVP38/TMEM64 family protein [Nitrospirae bacterium]|nr:TVP38/TMEM64 family inner membrane protein YdjZ [bacterium BMS3Abin10]GBE37952.1 TVP38/TMEM64 family inner membrane protein YdjZ [bacterium BMS3Bbin08]HDH50796.1 TVP38/TMEM64 family protein [Nitrospirota bacterium]HDO26395.1 TVP38/TMEM64 family protein [Nitrospirota bacterium]HDZ84535.1 TVP38/TMEM64 family protein [Nitrospirota bacterium]
MNKKHVKKIIIVLVIILLIAVFKVFNLGEYFSLAYIKESQEKFDLLYAEHRVTVIAVYMLIYIVMAALSLPGAVIMGLAGGALFGFIVATVAVSFSSTIGATLACFVSRFILRDWMQGKFGDKLKTVNRGIEKEGPFYLFTLRLIPMFPFWLINLVMGLTKMRLRTFFWVSQIGMLPGTMVFVNAGKELGKIDSPSGIFSPGLILSFVILGLFPIAVKKLMALYKSRKEKQY